MTKLFLSHWPALRSHGIPFLEDMFQKQIADNAHPAQYIAFGKRPRNKGAASDRVEYINKETPQGAVLYDKSVVSPEFAFLQVAFDLTMQERVALGKAMCCTPHGRPDEAVTTVEKMTNLIRQCHYHRGRKAALQALKYIRNESRSPMEIYTYMLLCLPNKWGGAGFAGGIFNQEIILKTQRGTRYVYADIGFPEQKVVIEYDGEHHDTPYQRPRDARRIADLRANGYTVIVVVKHDIYSLSRHANLIERIARALEKKQRFTTEDYAQDFLKIFALLPGDHSKLITIVDPVKRGRQFLQSIPVKFRRFYERIGVPLRLLNPT